MEIKELFGFEGKNVVITGAASGMGKAACELLIELGANVYAADLILLIYLSKKHFKLI